MTKRSMFEAGAVILISAMISLAAKAETVVVNEKPSAIIKTSDVAKALAKNEVIWKCEQKKSGKNVNPVKLKNSIDSYHTAVGESIDDVGTPLAEGKSLYFCSTVYMDKTTGRVRKIQD